VPEIKSSNPHNYTGKVTLQRVHLDMGGYDNIGAYWGRGAPLYWYFCEDMPQHTIGREGHFRARDRKAAKAHLRAMSLMSECRFWN
jgi:hypothetical protein